MKLLVCPKCGSPNYVNDDPKLAILEWQCGCGVWLKVR